MKIKTGPYRGLRRSFAGLLHGPVFDSFVFGDLSLSG